MATSTRFQILVCDGPSCGVCHGSEALREHIARRIDADPRLQGRVFVTNLTCFGRCDDGPNLMVRPLDSDQDGEQEPGIEDLEGVRGLYLGNDVQRIDRILEEHCTTGQAIAAWVETY
jgi:(2Fe-2S) ferredoxin